MKNNIIRIKLVLIRHGITAGNKERRYIGTTDEPLTEEGKTLLYEAKEAGRYREAAIVFSSPMKRCIQTAEILYPGQSIFPVEEWREMDFGEFEGKNYTDLKGRADYQAWIDSNGTLPFPGGESREEFCTRSMSGLSKVLDTLAEQTGGEKEPLTAACIVHGGTIMALLSSLGIGGYFDFQCANGEGYEVELYDKTSGKITGEIKC